MKTARRAIGRPSLITFEHVRLIEQAKAARAKLTCKALAQRTGLSYGTVANLMRGRRPRRFAPSRSV